jgi:hypothetical protein
MVHRGTEQDILEKRKEAIVSGASVRMGREEETRGQTSERQCKQCTTQYCGRKEHLFPGVTTGKFLRSDGPVMEKTSPEEDEDEDKEEEADNQDIKTTKQTYIFLSFESSKSSPCIPTWSHRQSSAPSQRVSAHYTEIQTPSPQGTRNQTNRRNDTNFEPANRRAATACNLP